MNGIFDEFKFWRAQCQRIRHLERPTLPKSVMVGVPEIQQRLKILSSWTGLLAFLVEPNATTVAFETEWF